MTLSPATGWMAGTLSCLRRQCWWLFGSNCHSGLGLRMSKSMPFLRGSISAPGSNARPFFCGPLNCHASVPVLGFGERKESFVRNAIHTTHRTRTQTLTRMPESVSHFNNHPETFHRERLFKSIIMLIQTRHNVTSNPMRSADHHHICPWNHSGAIQSQEIMRSTSPRIQV